MADFGPWKGQFPDLDGVVPAAGVEGGVVGGQSQGGDDVGVTGERSGAGLVVEAPDLDGGV